MSAIPLKYAPPQLTRKDKKAQIKMLIKSRALYKKNQYYTRKKINSYKNKKSNHVANAMKLYNVKNVTPSAELSSKTGCSIAALRQIVRKGEGAIGALFMDTLFAADLKQSMLNVKHSSKGLNENLDAIKSSFLLKKYFKKQEKKKAVNP